MTMLEGTPLPGRALWCSLTAACLAALLCVASSVRAEEPAPPAWDKQLTALEGVTRRLATAGMHSEVELLLDVLPQLGHSEKAVEKLRTTTGRTLGRVSRTKPKQAAVAKQLRRTVAAIADHLEGLPAERRTVLAGILLQLDGEQERAHAVLGHVQDEGAWVTAGMPEMLARRHGFEQALQRVRRMEVELEFGPSSLPFVAQVHGVRGFRVRHWCGFELHSAAISRHKLERVAREAIRALALTHFVETGELKIPKLPVPIATINVGSTVNYHRAIEFSVRAGGMSAEEGERYRTMGGYFDSRGFQVMQLKTEAPEAAWHLYDLWYELHDAGSGDHEPQACLQAGVLNWISLAYLGTTIPDVSWVEVKENEAARGTTSDRREELFSREELWRLARGGIAGTRARMLYLAERGEDPAFATAIVDEVGQIEGDALNKVTLVAAFLHERDQLARLLAETKGKPARPETFTGAFDESLAAFEARWRAWLIPLGRGLVERLQSGAESGPALAPEERRLLTYLNALRVKALPRNQVEDYHEVRLSRELSDGCRAHAAYLARHPGQAAAWPDAHEEYPDEEGFSPAGNRAGLNAVIAPGSKDERDAVDGWMGTFYHRLPLLDPGLLRVGWGLVDGMAVMDSGSFVAPAEFLTRIVWPYSGMKDVPLAFNAELPHPKPGEDQSTWGYPITLQLFRIEVAVDPSFELTTGGAAVPCWLSTPENPTNPELAPAGAYCLIPKQRLRPSTTYAVRVTGLPDEEGELVWSFKTGQ